MSKAYLLPLSSARLHSYIRPVMGACPGPFCSSRSGGQAFNRSRKSSLLSALFRCRTRLFRQCCYSPQPQENHHTFLITPPSGGLYALPVNIKTPLMAPHLPANPYQLVGQGNSRFVVGDTGRCPLSHFVQPFPQWMHTIRACKRFVRSIPCTRLSLAALSAC